MAAKVNTKFVILLSAFLVVVGAGVGGAYYMFKVRSGEHYVTLGDKAMSEGRIEAADSWYERAVGKEQFNVAWLKKWKATREQVVPQTQNAYVASYQMYRGILRNLAQSQKTNIEAHRDYLEMMFQECMAGPSTGAWEFLTTSVEESLDYFETDPENPMPPAIRRYRGLALSELMGADPNFPKDRSELARQDLEAALKANPADGFVASALSQWHRIVASRALIADDEALSKVHEDLYRAVIDDFVRANPSDPLGMIALLSAELIAIDRLNDPTKSTGENLKVRDAALEALAPRIAQIVEAAKAAPDVPYLVVNRIVSTANSPSRWSTTCSAKTRPTWTTCSRPHSSRRWPTRPTTPP